MHVKTSELPLPYLIVLLLVLMLLFPFVLYPISLLVDDSVDIIGVIGTTAPFPIPLVKSDADVAVTVVVVVSSPEN